jgi:hypothetical protein
MKTQVLVALMACSALAQSAELVTTLDKPTIGCGSQADMRMAVDSLAAADEAALMQLVNSGRCELLPPRSRVYLEQRIRAEYTARIRRYGQTRPLFVPEGFLKS